jgi:hypothetical protein
VRHVTAARPPFLLLMILILLMIFPDSDAIAKDHQQDHYHEHE